MDSHGFPEDDFGIIIYGSLIHKSDLTELFTDAEARANRIRVRGFRRVFDMAADRRDTVGDRRAVLNLHRDTDSWCNGLLVTDVTPREYGVYARRETEYRTTLVERGDISFYSSESNDIPSEIIVPYDGPAVSGILPIPSYLKRCLMGARQWGSLFYRDFIQTTELSSGTLLATYLRDECVNASDAR